MSARRIRLDLITHRVVRDANGRRIGRIHDVRAERRGDAIVLLEYHLGPAALLERFGLSLLSVLGVGREPIRIPWDRLDLTDAHCPRFLGTVDELRR